MRDALSQLTLGFRIKDEATFENFYPGRNAEMVMALKKSSSGQGEKIIYFCGQRGQGHSHLLQACCHEAYLHQLTSVYLPLSNLVSLTPDMLVGLETLDLVCLDDVQAIAGKRDWEEAVFNLYNRIYDNGGRIIMSAQELPKALHLTLPDLESRLSFGVIYQLHPLSDEEKLTVLTMRSDLRGIHLSEEVGRFILTHCPREMGALFEALDTLDKASLALQRRLTIPFVKEVLKI